MANSEITWHGEDGLGSREIHIEFPKGMKWARFAAWDSAGNGAFRQPVFFKE